MSGKLLFYLNDGERISHRPASSPIVIYYVFVSCLFFLLSCTPPKSYIFFTPRHGVYHTIKKGQTLYRIAKTYGVSVNELVRANRIKDVTNIPVGTRIFIPGAKRPLPVPIYQPPLDLKKRPEFIWPLKGKVISNFGPRGNGFHKGIDIKSKPGTLICASANGKVVFSGWMRGYGNVVILEHEGDFYTIYAHNTKNLVLEGAFIQRGQGIALVGSTGRATCPHLHFEIRIGNKAKDPLHYLPVRP